MKRSAGIALLLFAAAFLAIALWKSATTGSGSEAGPVDEARRQRISGFWEVYHRATELRTSGQWPAAAEAYRQALTVKPDHEDSIYYLGNCLFELGEYHQAQELYLRLITQNPRSSRGHSQLGVTLSTFLPGAAPDLDRARTAFERNAELNPEESGSFLRLGTLELNRGRLDAAFQAFEKAAGFASAEGAFWAGFVRFRQKRMDQASEWFAKVRSIAAQEQRISSRGARVEGDRAKEARQVALSPLQKAALKANLFHYWMAPASARSREDFQPAPAGVAPKPLRSLPLPAGATDGRGRWGDFDGDGDADLAVATAGGIRLFENRAGSLREAAAPKGLQAEKAWDLAWGDFDGDGRLDLYLIGSDYFSRRQSRLFRNLGAQGFQDVTEAVGLLGARSTVRAALVDVDGDSDADLIEVGGDEGSGSALRLFRNQQGRFRLDSSASGLQLPGTAVDFTWIDFNRDHRPELVVLRWRRPPAVFENDGSGHFHDVSDRAGLEAYGENALTLLSFDYDRDGWEDLYIGERADYESAIDSWQAVPLAQTRTGRLLHNQGNWQLVDVSAAMGLQQGFGILEARAGDVNGDGWPDLLLVNGGLDQTRIEPCALLLNQRGTGFEAARFVPGFEPVGATSASLADINDDGRLEIFLGGVGLFSGF